MDIDSIVREHSGVGISKIRIVYQNNLGFFIGNPSELFCKDFVCALSYFSSLLSYISKVLMEVYRKVVCLDSREFKRVIYLGGISKSRTGAKYKNKRNNYKKYFFHCQTFYTAVLLFDFPTYARLHTVEDESNGGKTGIDEFLPKTSGKKRAIRSKTHPNRPT